MTLSKLAKAVAAAWCFGAVCGYLVGAIHTDHTFVQAVHELFVIRDLIEAEL